MGAALILPEGLIRPATDLSTVLGTNPPFLWIPDERHPRPVMPRSTISAPTHESAREDDPPVPTNREQIDHLLALRAQAQLGGGEKRIEQQHAKGKLTARE